MCMAVCWFHTCAKLELDWRSCIHVSCFHSTLQCSNPCELPPFSTHTVTLMSLNVFEIIHCRRNSRMCPSYVPFQGALGPEPPPPRQKPGKFAKWGKTAWVSTKHEYRICAPPRWIMAPLSFDVDANWRHARCTTEIYMVLTSTLHWEGMHSCQRYTALRHRDQGKHSVLRHDVDVSKLSNKNTESNRGRRPAILREDFSIYCNFLCPEPSLPMLLPEKNAKLSINTTLLQHDPFCSSHTCSSKSEHECEAILSIFFLNKKTSERSEAKKRAAWLLRAAGKYITTGMEYRQEGRSMMDANTKIVCINWAPQKDWSREHWGSTAPTWFVFFGRERLKDRHTSGYCTADRKQTWCASLTAPHWKGCAFITRTGENSLHALQREEG